MTALVPCPLCGGSKGYTTQEGTTYRWLDLFCADCGDCVTDCRVDMPDPGSAWNEAGEGLRVRCQELEAALLRSESES